MTPDLMFLIKLYQPERNNIQEEYIKWAMAESVPEALMTHATFVINNYVRNWGHQFIYDKDVLTAALQDAGFVDIQSYELGESSTSELRGLEVPERMPPGFLELESMALEAYKSPEAGTDQVGNRS